MNFNPADYFVQTLAIVPGYEERCKERVKVWIVTGVVIALSVLFSYD